MVSLMQLLEPRLFQMNEIIFHDMEEVNEIIFVQQGDVSGHHYERFNCRRFDFISIVSY